MAKNIILLSIDQSKYNHRASVASMRKRLFPILTPVKRGLIAVAIFGYPAAIYFNRKYQTGAYNWIAYLALGALVIYYIMLRFQIQKTWRSVANTPSRLGMQAVTLDAEKMSLRHPGFHAEIYWSHVVDVIDGRDGLLVLIGALEAQPIPANAIPTDMTQDELKKQILDWIEQARN